MCDYDTKWPTSYVCLSYRGITDIEDIIKALCHLTGQNYDTIPHIGDLFAHKSGKNSGKEWGVWYEWAFFKVKAFKKGTIHFEFLDNKVLELFNRKVAELKGWQLPKSRKI